jgi:hypothetical protein
VNSVYIYSVSVEERTTSMAVGSVVMTMNCSNEQHGSDRFTVADDRLIAPDIPVCRS